MNYEAPKIKFVELETDDVIQTSGTPGGIVGDNELPFNPANPASVDVGDVEENY